MDSEFHESALSAVNEALVRLGHDVFVNVLSKAPDPDAVDASVSRKCAYLYEQAVRRVLLEYPWNFASRIETVASAFFEKGRYVTDLPGDCLQVQKCLTADGRRPHYTVCGRCVESDERLSKIIYTAEIEDVDSWHPEVRAVLVLRLVADFAKPITGRVTDVQLFEQQYNDLLERTKYFDARQNKPERMPWGRNYYADVMLGAGCAGEAEAFEGSRE